MSYPSVTWAEQGACATHPTPDLFFPARGESVDHARAICGRCTVQTECLNYALTNYIKQGVWGGLTERERRPLRPARPPGVRTAHHPAWWR